MPDISLTPEPGPDGSSLTALIWEPIHNGEFTAEALLADHLGWRVIVRVSTSVGTARIDSLTFDRVRPGDGAGLRATGPDGVPVEATDAIPTTDVLRALKVSDLRRALDFVLRVEGGPPLAEMLESMPDPLARRRGSDEELASWAARYVHAATTGGPRRVIADLAEQTGTKRETVRDRIRAARVKDFLTDTEQGVAGGQLTAKARRVLAYMEEDEQ